MAAKVRKLTSLAAALLVLALLGTALLPQAIQAQPLPAWWDTDWQYRMLIEITENSGSTLTNYQVPITIDTATFNYSKVEGSSGEDLRFITDSTECDYWIETWNTSGESKLWVEVPSLTASSTTNIYIYYGNSGASAASNESAVFDYVDRGDQTSSWTSVGSSGQSAAEGNPSPSYYAVSESGNYMYRNINLVPERIVTFNVKSDGLGNLFFLVDSSGAGQMYRLDTRGGTDYAGFATTSSWTSWNAPASGFSATADAWYKLTIVVTSSTSATLYYDQTTDSSPSDFGTQLGAYAITNNGGYIGLVGDGLGSAYTTWWDNIIVRKYANPEPTVNLGQEESSTSWMDYFGGTAAISVSTNVTVSDGDVELDTTSSTTTYDFVGINSPSSTHAAWYDTSSSFATGTKFPSGENGELSSANYDKIEADDAVNTGALIDSANKRHFRFRFLISEDPATITAIDPLWKGSEENGETQTLYIWKAGATNAWVSLGTSTSTTDAYIDPSAITTSISEYIDGEGYLYLACVAADPGFSNREFRTNYVKVEITYPQYKSPGNLTSTAITPGNLCGWDKFYANDNTNWQYRKPINITGTGTELTDYQINISVSYVSGKMNSDFSDLRFKDSSGYELNYWIESYVASSSAEVWVKVPTIAASGTTTIYMYYGNSGASTTSNFDNTFAKDYGESGLAALWHMDEGSGITTTDSSGNGNTGDLIGGLGWAGSDGGEWDNRSDVSFSTGDCLSYDGTTKYVEVSDSASLNITDDITIEVWVKPTWGSYPDWGMVYTDWYDASNQAVHFALYNGKVSLYISSSGANYDNLDGATALPLNQWSHIAVTFDSGTFNVYLNGAKDATQKVSGTVTSIFNSAYAKTIGIKNNAAHEKPFTGQIDEVRIYNRALSEDEIKCHYERRKYANPEPTPSFGSEESGSYCCFTGGSWDITYKILDASDDSVLCTIPSGQAAAGYDISSCAGSTSSVKLYAELSTTGSNTPTLHSWKVTWVTNTPPTVDSVALVDLSDVSVTAMTPQVEYNAKVTVTDANTLDDLSDIEVTIFYDADGSYANGDEDGAADTQSRAILTWTNGGSPAWAISPNTSTTWALVSGNCSTPALTGTTGTFHFHFKPGKVATETTGSAKWHIFAEADDGTATANNTHQNRDMNWYGEITVNTVNVDWGTVDLGADFSANKQGNISVTYLANGAYNEQISATSPWIGSGESISLDASGSPADGEFSLKADNTSTLASAVLVTVYDTFATIDNTGTQTSEDGDTVTTNTIWLKLGAAGIPAVSYSGTIYYRIAE